MAAGTDAEFQGALDDAQVLVHGLLAGQVHLVENVIVAAGNQHAGFGHAGLLDQFKVLFVGPDPGGDFRELQARVLAQAQGLLVVLRVEEELALADHALRAAQAAHEFEQVQDLLGREGADGLLAVTEGRVGHPDLVGHLHGHMAEVEGNLRDVLIVVDLAVQVGLRYVLQVVAVFGLHQQVGCGVKTQHLESLRD